VSPSGVEAHHSEPAFSGRKYLCNLPQSSSVDLAAVINEGYTPVCR